MTSQEAQMLPQGTKVRGRDWKPHDGYWELDDVCCWRGMTPDGREIASDSKLDPSIDWVIMESPLFSPEVAKVLDDVGEGVRNRLVTKVEDAVANGSVIGRLNKLESQVLRMRHNVYNSTKAIEDRLDTLTKVVRSHIDSGVGMVVRVSSGEPIPATPTTGRETRHVPVTQEFYVIVDSTKIAFPKRYMKAVWLKQAATGNSDYQLYRETDGETPDQLVRDNEDIDGMRHDVFVLVPPATWGAAKPKCDKCGDKKMLKLILNGVVTNEYALCPCVKVGDTVSAEVANLLPVGSRVQGSSWSSDAKAYWERTKDGWNGVAGGDTEPTSWSKSLNDAWMFDISWRIICIGPAPATTDVLDKAEEIARECIRLAIDTPSRSWEAVIADILRKHGVGQPQPLADLLADPRLKPVVEVARRAIDHWRNPNSGISAGVLFKTVGKLPKELQDLIEKGN